MNEELVPAWTGATGWLDRDWGKGNVLPPREGGSSLTEVAKSSSRNRGSPGLIRERPARQGVTPRKYSEVLRNEARALYSSGLTYQQIAERLQVPFGTIYNWLNERCGR